MKTTNLLSRFLRPAVRALAALACPAALAANVALPAAPTSLSSTIQSKIALWLRGDANLVADASGNVVAWCDAREAAVADEAAYEARVAAGSWSYPRALVYTSGAAPSGDVPLGADAPASFGGKPYVDFGEYNDNRWMLFVDAAGARKRVPLVGYAGYIGFGATAGFVVGDVNDPDIAAYSADGVGDNGRVFWHKEKGNAGDDYIYSSGAAFYGRYGETRVNGRIVNSADTKHVRSGWEIFMENGPSFGGYVSTLFNNGNFKQAVSGNGDRQGGGKVAEIMLFSEMLTQSEVAEVEAYLRGRWQGGAGSANDVIVLSSGDTLVADASTGPLFVGDIAGTGAIEKTGSGNFTIDRAGRLAAGPLTLRAGTVRSNDKRTHHMPLVAVGGTSVNVAGGALVAREAGDADTFTVTDTTAGRQVSLAGAESGVAKVAASKSAIVLRAPALPDPAVATSGDAHFLAIGNLIANGSFEVDSVSGASRNVLPAEWTRTQDSNTGTSTYGITTTSDTTAWLNGNGGKVADGTKACYLQVNGISPISTNGIQQSVAVPASGLYQLSLAIRCRQRGGASGTNSLPAWVAVDGVNVLARRPWRVGAWNSETGKFETDTSATEFTFKRVSVNVALSAGDHVVAINAVNHDGFTGHSTKYDRALIVDDVRLEPVAPGDFVLVPDSGFDSCDFWHANEINSNDGGSLGWSWNPFWTVSGSGRISRYPSVWFSNEKYAESGEDQQAALQNGATASQKISFPKAGRIRVSLRYASRSDPKVSRTSGQSVVVSVGGTQFDSRVVSTQDWRTLVAEGDVEAGDQTLSIQSTNIGTDTATIVDDVRIEYVGSSSRIVDDTAFATDSSTWTLGDSVSVDEDAWGLRELVFMGSASASATFTAPSNGVYLLTYQTRGRPLSQSGTSDGVYHSYLNYSHNLDVKLDGGLVANYYGETAGVHPVEMRLPYLTAGEHVLLFQGSGNSAVSAAAQSRISDVTVTPLATGAMADWSGVEFELDSDAKINADLPGTVRLGKLKVAGVTKYGEFTAANCDFVTGAGTVEIIPEAFVLVVR